MQKTIAVILPVYHKDKVEYIQLAVNSILNQTYSYIKTFIGVDGPVGDEIKECLIEYERRGNVQLVWFPENRGLASVLNDLLQICFDEGFDYIARMDADDISFSDRIKKQVMYLDKHPEIDVVGAFSLDIDENGEQKGTIYKHPATPEGCRKIFAYSNPLGHPVVMFRKSFFEKAGCLYRPEYRTNQDTLLWYDGLKKGVQMANLQEPLLYFRATSDMYKKRRGGYKKAKKQLQDRLMINKGLGYGFKANVYAYCVFLLMVSPSFMRRLAYDIMKR